MLNIYEFISYCDGLAKARNKKTGKWGFINESGEEVIPCKYDMVFQFVGGFAEIVDMSGDKSKFGLINKEGVEIVLCKYEQIGYFTEGFCPASKGKGKWGFINEQGEEVIPFIYDRVDNFGEGLAAVCKKGKWGYIDDKGVLKIPFAYSDAACFEKNGLSAVQEKNGEIRKWGAINKKGEKVIDCVYDNLFQFCDDEFAIVEKSDKWGAINAKGEEIVPCKYKRSMNAYKKAIDKVVPFFYDKEDCNEGLNSRFVVKYNGRWVGRGNKEKWVYDEEEFDLPKDALIFYRQAQCPKTVSIIHSNGFKSGVLDPEKTLLEYVGK